MRRKEEIMEKFSRVKNQSGYSKFTRDGVEWAYWDLVLELLIDIRDDQIAHNNTMERLANLKGIK